MMRTRLFFTFTGITSLPKAGCITIARSMIFFTGVCHGAEKSLSFTHSKRPIALRLVYDSCGFLRQRVIILALAQRLIPAGERSSLLTHIAATESGSLCVQMKG